MLAGQRELPALSLAKSRGITLALNFSAQSRVHCGLRRFAARVPQALGQDAFNDLFGVKRRSGGGDHLSGGVQAAQRLRGFGGGGSLRGLPFGGLGFVAFHLHAFLRTRRD